jgi:hypothetical protein
MNRHDCMRTVQDRVRTLEDPAVYGIIADGNHDFLRRYRFIGSQEGFPHVTADRTFNQQHVGMPRRSDKVDTEALHIIKGIAQGRQLLFAGVGRTGGHYPDRQGTFEELPDMCLYAEADRQRRCLIRRRSGVDQAVFCGKKSYNT